MTDRTDAILARLAALRTDDAPTHGGRVLSYVYDSGLAELDELALRASAAVQSINGLDPTTFPSVARMERDVIDFAIGLVGGQAPASGQRPVGLVTSGGTESCLLAVKSARERWRAQHPSGGRAVLLIAATAHAAFHKAAQYFDLDLEIVPVNEDGVAAADHFAQRLGDRTALVVVSAPNYPFAGLDPVAEVAGAAADAGVPCHVDACIGGWVLPFWASENTPTDALPPWDFSVAGVSSISMDAHKYGYAPKGASVLLFADRDAKRAAGFATTRWPGYPVVNPTMLGSRSATSLAASWAIIEYLSHSGFSSLTHRIQSTTTALVDTITAIRGLRVVGQPTGPLLAVATDSGAEANDRVDPHLWADKVRALGWVLQPQPGLRQPGAPDLPHTTHLTLTPVTADAIPELTPALVAAADAVRGVPPVDLTPLLPELPDLGVDETLDSAAAQRILTQLGLGSEPSGPALPADLAPVMALLEIIPPQRAESLLTELLARLNEH